MNKIFGARGTGKTVKMLEAANNTDSVIVTRDPQSLREKAFILGFKNVNIISFGEFFRQCHTGSYQEADKSPAYIHDLEKYLEYIHQSPIQGFTCSVD